MNKIILSGNVSSNPEIKTTKSGTSVCVFNVAVNIGDHADFYRVNAWSKLGEICSKYVSKGSKVFVIGDLKPSIYESKGKTYMNLDVTAEKVEFMSGKKEEKTDDFTDINPNDLPF